VGVAPQTLRLWESKGLVKPLRSKGGTRYYREEDLESLRRIKRLRAVEGLNFAAIRRELEGVGVSCKEDSEVGSVAEKTGERLRQLRLRRGKTLEEIAAATGLSASFISKLERGDSGASITSFNAMAKAYGVSVREIFGAELEPSSPLVEPDGRPTMSWANGVRFEDLAAGGSLMDPSLVSVPPRTGSEGFYSHSGEEFIYALSGVLFVQLEGQEAFRLAAEHSLYFPSTTPHAWWTEDEGAKLIWVNTPAF